MAGCIFHTDASTGVAVMTAQNRIFIVNNIKDPKVKKMADISGNVLLKIKKLIALLNSHPLNYSNVPNKLGGSNSMGMGATFVKT